MTVRQRVLDQMISSAKTDPGVSDAHALSAGERDVVASRMDEHEAARIAERYTGYVLRSKRRALVSPTVTVISSRLVYKPFWIVTYTESGTLVRVLVDGITGGFHPLRFSGTRM